MVWYGMVVSNMTVNNPGVKSTELELSVPPFLRLNYTKHITKTFAPPASVVATYPTYEVSSSFRSNQILERVFYPGGKEVASTKSPASFSISSFAP